MSAFWLSQPVRTRRLYPYPYPHPHPGNFTKGHPQPRVLCHGGVHNWAYTTCRSCGYGQHPGYGSVRALRKQLHLQQHWHGNLVELTEVPGTGMEASQNSQKLHEGVRLSYPYPYPHQGILTRAYPTPGIGPRAYSIYGYGRACRTELAEGYG